VLQVQMQTRVSPSTCRAFLGCQVEKAVDELNLTRILCIHETGQAVLSKLGLWSMVEHGDVELLAQKPEGSGFPFQVETLERRDASGQVVESCSILTTTPNALLADVH